MVKITENDNPANIISTNVYGAFEGGGRYWTRTSDLVHVRHAL